MAADSDVFSPATAWEAAWSDALAALELDLTRAEQLLADPTRAAELPTRPTWVAPELQGPMPAGLVPRARAIADRQLRVAEALSRAVVAARGELRLTERLHAQSDRSTPVFFDASV
jgi:hypothetical protein